MKVVLNAPVCNAPWTAAAAPPSLCIWVTLGTVPQRFGLFSDIQASAHSPIFEDGVIG